MQARGWKGKVKEVFPWKIEEESKAVFCEVSQFRLLSSVEKKFLAFQAALILSTTS